MSEAADAIRNPSRDLVAFIRERLARHLDCQPNEIDTGRAFYSFGLSSLNAMILMGELEERTGLEIDPQIYTVELTIDELVAEVTGQLTKR
jgi:acyl carrier protein